MLESTIALIILSLGLGLAAWLAFVWAVRKGEFDDPEGPKYRMLNDDDEPSAASPPGAGDCGAEPTSSGAPTGRTTTGLPARNRSR